MIQVNDVTLNGIAVVTSCRPVGPSGGPAARSKAQVCGRSPAEIVSSNPPGGMDVCLLCVLCVVR
jgi:hypothetical protein